jgi:flagellar basal body rod protein FlgG
MGTFDQGYAGMASLRAVNEWIGVINSNLGGANRTAYKATKVSFGGGVTRIDRDPRVNRSGLQIPDSTLSVANTRIDFSQGTIVQDGELTHLAISGDGFFGVTDGRQLFFTRDGDFRWSVINNQTILTTANGLTVLPVAATTNNSATPSPDGVLNPADSTTYFLSFAIARNPGTSGATFSVTINTVAGGISLADGTANLVAGATGTNGICIAVFRFANNNALKFSRYGSTVFDATNAGIATVVNDVDLIQSALESSNAALNDTLPELSLAQKMFSAVSKIINVHNSNLDVTVNLIR